MSMLLKWRHAFARRTRTGEAARTDQDSIPSATCITQHNKVAWVSWLIASLRLAMNRALLLVLDAPPPRRHPMSPGAHALVRISP